MHEGSRRAILAADVARTAETLVPEPSVRRTIHPGTEHPAPEELLAAVELDAEPAMSIEQLSAAVDGSEHALHAAVPSAQLLLIDRHVSRAPSR